MKVSSVGFISGARRILLVMAAVLLISQLTACARPLHGAAIVGDIDKARSLLDQGADVNAKIKDGWTPLHFAAEKGHTGFTKLLIDRDADVNTKNIYGVTPLHLAVRNGHTEIAKLLIESDADVNAKIKDGWTTLHYAVFNGHTETAKLLIESDADINVKDNNGATALDMARSQNKSAIVALIQEEIERKNGTKVASVPALGASLLYAVVDGNINKVRSILDKGADVNTRIHKYIKYRGVYLFEGSTPLFAAAQKGRDEIARLLIERGADINAKSIHDGTPLHLAAGDNHIETVKLLIKSGADINAENNEGETALDTARKRTHYETVHVINEAMYKLQATEIDSATAQTAPGAPVAPVAPNVTSIVDTPPTTRMPVNPNAYAVVIGIEKYRERLPDAPYAKSDAEIMAKYLTESMGFEKRNVAVLINERATRGDLSKYLGTWLRNRVKPESRVFVYYSGHGAPDVKTNSAYIVPYDGDPTYITDTGYPLKKLYEDLGKLKAKEIIVALDSCFSGAGERSVIAKGARPIALKLKNPAIAAGNMVVLSASSGVQASSTYEDKGHGLFTYYLLKGLQGAADADKSGAISVKELHEYIGPKVETIALEEYNNEQTPQMMDPSDLSSEMVLIKK